MCNTRAPHDLCFKESTIMAITIRLDEEESWRLQQLVSSMSVNNQSEVIRQLIDEKWQAIQADSTFVEKRGGHPMHLLDGPPTESLRATRKAKMAAEIDKKAKRRRAGSSEKHTD